MARSNHQKIGMRQPEIKPMLTSLLLLIKSPKEKYKYHPAQESHMKQPRLDEGIRRLKEFVRKNRFIYAAYLFGSAASGNMGPLSDIDVAFYLKHGKKSHKEMLVLQTGCMEMFKPFDVDVVVMNKATNTMNYNIISKGKLISSNNENERILFETSILHEYLDLDYHERRQAELGIARIAARGLA